MALTLTACAGGSARVTSTSDIAGLPRPSIALVYPFAMDAHDAAADTFGYNNESTDEARQVASTLADKIAAAFRERGIRAEPALRSTQPPLHAIVVKGQFVTIEKGSAGERVLIGFSAGSEDVKVRVQAYQVTEAGLRQLQEGFAETHGRKSPGVGVPAIVSIATGNPAGVVISGGVNVASELLQGFDKRLEVLARQIADLARDYYARQGWL